MITLSQKSQYALRGIFELAKCDKGAPATVAELAAAQSIPHRFLELIFNDLRQAGLVKSFRGPQGGHVLVKPPSEITVGEILRLTEGPIALVKCVSGSRDCPFVENCPFREVWDEAAGAMEEVFNRTTIQQLLDKSSASSGQAVV